MHEIENKWLRLTLGGLGLVASAILLTVSGVANFRYGTSLARSEIDGWVYGSGAASSDMLMAGAPFFFFAAWKYREYVRMLAAFTVWAVTTMFAAQAAVSQASMNRIDAVGQRQVASTSYADIRVDLEEARKQRGFIPQHRPIATVKAELERHKTNRMWSASNECTEATGAQRAYCATYQTLNGELGYAMQEETLQKRIDDLQAKSDKATATNHSIGAREADPGAVTMAELSGRSIREVQSFSIFMIALVILVGAGLGPYASVALLRAPVPKSPKEPRFIDLQPLPVAERLPPPLPPEPPPVREFPIAEVLTQKAAPAPKLVQPVVAAKFAKRTEPTSEARDMLTAIGFPLAPIRNKQLRPKDPREHVAWRFLAWMAAYHLQGTYEPEKIDGLYAEFCAADHREQWGMRVVKNEMSNIRYCQSTSPDGRVKWNINPPAITKLVEQMTKKGVIKDSAKAVDEGDNVVPMVRPETA